MLSIKLARCCALSCFIACGNNQDTPALVDASPPDTPDDPPSNIVFVELFGSSPTFVRFRTDGGEWQEPIDTGDGYELTVGDDYELVAACASEVGSDVGFIASTYAEGSSTYIPCYAPSTGSAPVQVTGTMTTPGSVFINGGDTGDTPNWSFQLDVAIGTHDLIALDADRAIVQRDLEVLGDTKLPAIDTADGAALVERAFTTDALADEEVTTSLLWFTTNSVAYLPLGATTVKAPPTSLVGQFDTRYFSIDAASSTGYRSVYLTDAAADAPVTDVEFLPRLDGVTFNADGVTWSGTLPGEDADLYIYEGINSISVNASAGWLAGRNKLAIDTDIPGFDPAWRLANPDYRGFSVGDGGQQQFRSSAIHATGASLR